MVEQLPVTGSLSMKVETEKESELLEALTYRRG